MAPPRILLRCPWILEPRLLLERGHLIEHGAHVLDEVPHLLGQEVLGARPGAAAAQEGALPHVRPVGRLLGVGVGVEVAVGVLGLPFLRKKSMAKAMAKAQHGTVL